MDGFTVFLVGLVALCLYCTGASWMLQFVCYPTYSLVGEKEFVPFHIDFGRRFLIAIIPMSLTCLALIALVFVRPETIPLWAAIVAAICGAVILGTTIALEVPKHMKLDKDGKSDALIRALVRDNIPRTICWTLASASLLYMLVVLLQA